MLITNNIVRLLKKKKTRKNHRGTFDESTIRNISPSRNILKVRSKYMKLSKEELVDKLIQTEQYLVIIKSGLQVILKCLNN